MTLEEVYTGLSSRMDIMTNELVNVGRKLESVQYRVTSIEAGFLNVELSNGLDVNGQREVIFKPRQQFIQSAYDMLKTGGELDVKLNKCRDDHDPHKINYKIEKKFDVYFKWAERIALIIMALAYIILAIDWNKLAK